MKEEWVLSSLYYIHIFDFFPIKLRYYFYLQEENTVMQR